jgi:hypothetical protein
LFDGAIKRAYFTFGRWYLLALSSARFATVARPPM